MVLNELEKLVSRFSSTLGVAVRNLAETGRTKKQCFSIAVDMSLVVVSLWLAYTLRYGEAFSSFKPNIHIFVLLPIATVLVLVGLGVYRWVIRSSNEHLTRSIIKGGVISSFVLVLLLHVLPPTINFPRSVFAIYGLLFTVSAISVRYLWRSFFGENSAHGSGERVAIYGAGRAGQQLAGLMRLDESRNPVLFIDDNPKLHNSTLAGLPVVCGSVEELRQEVMARGVTRIVLAVPKAKGQQYAEIVNKLSGVDVAIQTMPTLAEIMSGRASPDQVRDLSVDDLLGRSVVAPDDALMRQCVAGKVVLVTGGGGSIGSEICRQVVLLNPARLIVLEQSEENLYKITEEIHRILDGDRASRFLPVLGSVTNREKLDKLFSANQINTVYHAAAYKHVPIVEHYPEEAISVNVFGTLNVLETAISHAVDNFTLISTDKAVRPANVMGATKRIAEMILQAKSGLEHQTVICMVRFGNVLGSSGSVVPKFKQQISEGGPVTITHRDITRYFMTIPEASQLVLQATALARGGEIYVLDMGEPVNIYEFAILMINLSGKTVKSKSSPFGDIEIKEIGLRPGEKMYEELFVAEEAQRTPVQKIFVSQEAPVEWDDLVDILSAEHSSDYRQKKAFDLVVRIKKGQKVNRNLSSLGMS